MVLGRLGLTPARISTQILPPEPLAYYLISCAFMSASLGQFGLDARHLMRTEIAELAEPFEAGQVGSSTMAHKRNPLNFENEEGMWEGVKAELYKVLSLLTSEHQRDLVGSSLARDLPTIVVKLVYQLDTFLRPGKHDPRPFIERIVPDADAFERNLLMQKHVILAEPLYITLQMTGYEDDAHALVNERAMQIVHTENISVFDAVRKIAEVDEMVAEALSQIPQEVSELLGDPKCYTGKAVEKTLEVCEAADIYLV